MEVRNAVIRSAEITTEDHGILTAWLNLDYGGLGQGFGGYRLDGRGNGGTYIRQLMDVVGVERWSNLKGKTVRVECDESRIVRRIGHIIDDRWFDPELALQNGER